MSEALLCAILTGDTGNDTFVMNDDVPSGANLSADAYSVVTDFKKGDALQLIATHFEPLSNPDTGDSFDTLVGEAANQSADYSNHKGNNAVWFEFAGSTYVVAKSVVGDTSGFMVEHTSIIELEHVQLSVTGFDYVDGSDMVVGA